MNAKELFEHYKSLEASETLKFDILHENHLEKRDLELQSLREEIREELSSPDSNFSESFIVQDMMNMDSLNGVCFTIDDIKDQERLEVEVERETMEIFKSENSRGGRDLETVRFFVKQGKVAEFWLIENREYRQADKKWHDLIDPRGDLVEVKAYDVWSKDAPGVQRDVKKLKSSTWNFSRWYILFKCKHGKYEFLERIQLK